MMTVRDLHADLVRFPSLSREEAEIATFVETTMRGVDGLEVGRLGDNVWASLGTGDDLFLLCSHLDVVRRAPSIRTRRSSRRSWTAMSTGVARWTRRRAARPC